VGGVALKDRLPNGRPKGFAKRLKGISLPKPTKGIGLDKLNVDLDRVSSTAQRVGNYGRRVDEVASAVKNASDSAKKSK
jgi:hypothetical protein